MPYYIFLLIACVCIFLLYRLFKHSGAQSAKQVSIRQLYKNSDVYLCFSMDSIEKGILQMYGESTQTPLRAGMSLRSPWGENHIIKEVYADDDTPDKPDEVVQPNVPDTPVVISEEGWNQEAYSTMLAEQGVVVFTISIK